MDGGSGAEFERLATKHPPRMRRTLGINSEFRQSTEGNAAALALYWRVIRNMIRIHDCRRSARLTRKIHRNSQASAP
jgi:hypothetical protein